MELSGLTMRFLQRVALGLAVPASEDAETRLIPLLGIGIWTTTVNVATCTRCVWSLFSLEAIFAAT